MINIGLTGWGDHPDVYSSVTAAKDKLFDYSGHFPVVELDTSFMQSLLSKTSKMV